MVKKRAPRKALKGPVSMDMTRLDLSKFLTGAPAPREHVIGVGAPRTRHPFKAPVLPPGVLPNAKILAADNYVAFDDGSNLPLYSYGNTYACGMGFPGYPYLAELQQRSEYRAPCEVTAQEMTRRWIKFISKGKADDAAKGEKLTKLDAAFKRYNIRDVMRQAIEVDEKFGRSQTFIDVTPASGAPKDGPGKDVYKALPLLVDSRTIKRGSLNGFKVIEPMWSTPSMYNSNDPTEQDFYVPDSWYVMGRKVHHTRLLTMIAHPVPDMLKPAYNFGGISLTQLMEPYVNIWLRTRTSVADIVRNFSIIVLSTDMTAILAGPEQGGTSDPASLIGRIKLFQATRDNKGVMTLDKGKEELTQIAVPLSSLDALQSQAQEHMAAPCHIPLVKLTGVTPSGLNASSEGEIQVFYDYIHARQEAQLEPILDTILDIVQLSEFGEIDQDIDYEFVELTEPTAKEKSEMRKADSDRDVAYITNGVVDPAEVRQKLIDDPDSGYNALTGPPPDPMDNPMLVPPEPDADDEGDDEPAPPKKD